MNRHTQNPRYPRTSPKLVINITLDEKVALGVMAQQAGCTVSELVRAALVKAGVLMKQPK